MQSVSNNCELYFWNIESEKLRRVVTRILVKNFLMEKRLVFR